MGFFGRNNRGEVLRPPKNIEEMTAERHKAAEDAIKSWKLGGGYTLPRQDMLGSRSYWLRIKELLSDELGKDHACTQEADRIFEIFDVGNTARPETLTTFVTLVNENEPFEMAA